MLTKEDVIARLGALDLNPGHYWVTAGAALLFYGLRETTADIDLGCDRVLADQLEVRGYDMRREADGRRRFHLPGEVDISEDFGLGPVQQIQGIPVVSPCRCAGIEAVSEPGERPVGYPPPGGISPNPSGTIKSTAGIFLMLRRAFFT